MKSSGWQASFLLAVMSLPRFAFSGDYEPSPYIDVGSATVTNQVIAVVTDHEGNNHFGPRNGPQSANAAFVPYTSAFSGSSASDPEGDSASVNGSAYGQAAYAVGPGVAPFGYLFDAAGNGSASWTLAVGRGIKAEGDYYVSYDLHFTVHQIYAVSLTGSVTGGGAVQLTGIGASHSGAFDLEGMLAPGSYELTAAVDPFGFSLAVGPGSRTSGSGSFSFHMVLQGLGFGPVVYGPQMLIGDLNGNGLIDFPDLLTLAQNYGKSNATYLDGDITLDGKVDFQDLLYLAQNYGASLPVANPATMMVPEPGVCLVLTIALVGRRRV